MANHSSALRDGSRSHPPVVKFQKLTFVAYPFTHTTCLRVCITSTRSVCAAITASMSL